jgi:cobalamin biosynthesis protein CobD/CbiB
MTLRCDVTAGGNPWLLHPLVYFGQG